MADASGPGAHARGSSGAERRSCPRYEVTDCVDYTGTEVLLYHQIDNLSLGGMGLRTTALEQVGTVVDLVISILELQRSLAVQGEVVWANAREPKDLGIRFLNLDQEQQSVLRRYMQVLEERQRR